MMSWITLLILLVHILLTISLYLRTKGSSLSSAFSLALLIQVLIPVYVVSNLEKVNNITLDRTVLQRMLDSFTLYMCIVIPFLLIVYFIDKYFKRKNTSEKQTEGYVIRPVFIYIFTVMSIVQLLTMFIDGKIQFIISNGLKSLSSDNYASIRVALIEQGNTNYQSSALNYVKIIASSGTSFGYLLFLYTANVNRPFFKKYFSIVFFIGLVVFLMSLSGLEKAPIALFIFITVLVRYSNRIKKFGYMKLFIGFIILNVFAITLIAITTGQNISESFIFLYYRVFLEPTASSYMHFATFPDQINWVMFSNFNFIKNLFGLPTVLTNGSIAIDVAESFTGLYYSANANLVATGWAQNGLNGVAIYTVLAFSLFFLVDFFTMRYSANGSVKILKYYYLFWFIYFANSSIENFILTSGCIVWPIVLAMATRKQKT